MGGEVLCAQGVKEMAKIDQRKYKSWIESQVEKPIDYILRCHKD